MKSPWRYLSALTLALTLVLTLTSPTAAHEGEPLRQFEVQAGPYLLVVSFWGEPLGGQELVFTIEARGEFSGPLTYQVLAVPGPAVNAVPVRAQLALDPEHPQAVEGKVNLPISGDWLLSIDIEGPLGPGFDDVPILAGAPPAVPEWVGWAVGLIPAYALFGFFLAQALRPARDRKNPEVA